MSSDLPFTLRRTCAVVADRARYVAIDRASIPAYARRLENDGLAAAPPSPADETLCLSPGRREDTVARTLILDAINFGSGWFPTLAKRDGLSGYRTVAAGLRDRFDAHGPWTAQELTQLESGELAATLRQDPGHPLIPLFVASLRDLGGRIGRDPWTSVVDHARGSALTLVAELATWECFTDESRYDELTLPFLKRAQIAAADLQRAGAAHFTDLKRLTIFADNLVPHVLALDGILILDDDLRARIAGGRLLTHGAADEVELRACAVHAAELIVAELGGRVTAAELDAFLWERGAGATYKASPRPRCRCTAY